MDLEKPCKFCHGDGEYDTRNGKRECHECDGLGTRPTEEGQKLLDFIEKYGNNN